MMSKILAVVAFTVVYLVLVLGLQAIIYTLFLGAPFYGPVESIVFVMCNALMFGLFFYYRHNTRDRWIKSEAEKWLTSRSRRLSTPVHIWRMKLRREMSWAPTVIVLIAFLFFPEAAGITSHLLRRRSFDHYRIEIPLTWIIARSNSSYLWALAGRGIARVGLVTYWRSEERISEMVFYTYSPTAYGAPNDEEPPAHAKVLSKQRVPFGKERITCWDIVPYADTRLDSFEPASAEIICSSTKNDFYANFSGWRIDSSSFYEVLQGAIKRE